MDAAIDHCPEVAKKIWGKVELWTKAVGKAKGTAMHEAVLYAAAHGLESMPRPLNKSRMRCFFLCI